MRHDVIVLGVGGAGSAAAYHLARRGLRVLALERFAIPHEMGSSHGATRIIRKAYFEHPSYVPLLQRAYELWRELEREAGEELLHITGSLDAGAADSRTVLGSLRSCEAHGLPYEVLTRDEVARRFPGFRLPPDFMAVLQPDGGFLEPERCVVAHARLAQRLGADVRTGERVLGWEPTGSGVRVTTERGVHEAAQLVVAAGSWAGALVPSLGRVLAPERQVVAWFAVEDRDLFAPVRFPVFNLTAEGAQWYGFPEFGLPGFKLGCYHHFRERVDPESLDRSAVTEADLGLLRKVVRSCFPAADGDVVRSSVCLFTNTPDEHFILDRLPAAPQVVIASACSGHGFKFTSVVGQIVADLVERGETGHDIGLHGLSRFAE